MNDLAPSPDGSPSPAASALSTLPEDPMSLAHMLDQGDTVSLILFSLLMGMSVASWCLIALKAASSLQEARRGRAFLGRFWNAGSLEDVRDSLSREPVREPFAELAAQALAADRHGQAPGSPRLVDTGGAEALLTRTLRQSLDQVSSRLENGLTALATIGATAPFVGLFGTVWGIHHALRQIGLEGGASLSRIAGPVGEALVMTAVGLAVAVPALVAYNAFGRRNRVLEARLDAFAFELMNLLTTGRALRDGAAKA